MNEEKESSSGGLREARQGEEKEFVTRGEREAFQEVKRTAKETLGIKICGLRKKEGYLVCNYYLNRKRKSTSIHRIIMMIREQRILSPDEHVHHVNGIKTDNRISNLEIITASEHARLHMKGRVSPNKGNRFKLTEEQRLKMRGPRSKKKATSIS